MLSSSWDLTCFVSFPLGTLCHAVDWTNVGRVRINLLREERLYCFFSKCICEFYLVRIHYLLYILSSVLLDKAWRHHCHLCLWTLALEKQINDSNCRGDLAILLSRIRNSQSCAARLLSLQQAKIEL